MHPTELQYTRKIQEEANKEANRLRLLGAPEDSDEIQAQQKIWIDADNSILDAKLQKRKRLY